MHTHTLCQRTCGCLTFVPHTILPHPSHPHVPYRTGDTTNGSSHLPTHSTVTCITSRASNASVWIKRWVAFSLSLRTPLSLSLSLRTPFCLCLSLRCSVLLFSDTPICQCDKNTRRESSIFYVSVLTLNASVFSPVSLLFRLRSESLAFGAC